LSFGSVAALYDRSRAGYAAAAVSWALPPGRPRVLDLAAGTGKLTAAIVAHGADVVAIEPSEGMLEVLRANLPGVDARIGSAEHTGLPDDDVDVIVIGSALHWFERPTADEEMARVLRAGGSVSVFGNRRDATLRWVSDLDHLVAERTGSAGDSGSRYNDRRPLDERWFGPPETEQFAFVHPMDADALAELYASRSYVISLEPDERESLLDRIRDFGRTHVDLAGHATFDMPYHTVVSRYPLLRS
jgi:SAM-dependent methyltransferase